MLRSIQSLGLLKALYTSPPLADLFISTSLGSIEPRFNYCVKTIRSHLSITVCIARYSFIQLSELWQRGVIKLAKGSKRPQWDLKPGSLD